MSTWPTRISSRFPVGRTGSTSVNAALSPMSTVFTHSPIGAAPEEWVSAVEHAPDYKTRTQCPTHHQTGTIVQLLTSAHFLWRYNHASIQDELLSCEESASTLPLGPICGSYWMLCGLRDWAVQVCTDFWSRRRKQPVESEDVFLLTSSSLIITVSSPHAP